jgi:hypothetical protein
MAKHIASWDEVEKEVRLVANMIKQLPDEHKVAAAVRIAFEAAVWGGATDAEMLGILELVKCELMQSFAEVEAEESEEDE